MKEKSGYVYVLARKKNGTLYIGVTANLHERILQHKAGLGSSFTAKYNVRRLVYFEELPQQEAADIMEINIKALESLLSRAKAALKDRMKSD